MVLMVLQKKPNTNSKITNEWRTQTFAKLLDFAEQQVELGEWTSDKIFSLFDSDMHTDTWFAMGTGMLTTFWEHLRKSVVFKRPSEKLVEEIKMFPYHYTYNRMTPMYRLACYLIPYENDDKESKSIREYLLNINKQYEDNISLFMEKLIRYIPNFQAAGNGWIEKYSDLENKIIKYLDQQNISTYPDVKNDIELMMDSISEILSLKNIISWVDNVDRDVCAFPSKFKKDTLEQTIQDFESALKVHQQGNAREIDQQFSNFFQWLQNEQNLVIDKYHLEKLHELVTLYVDWTGYASLPYRRLLLNIAANQTEITVNTDQ